MMSDEGDSGEEDGSKRMLLAKVFLFDHLYAWARECSFC
jgi:hypothetical protein